MATTQPGGVYIVNGIRVDANGNPIPEPKPEPKRTTKESA
jgi:hypothetical protein